MPSSAAKCQRMLVSVSKNVVQDDPKSIAEEQRGFKRCGSLPLIGISAFDGCGLRRRLSLRPALQASYPVLVHRLACLLRASFRPRLAAGVISPLRFAITSRPSRCEEDFHLQAIEHARHTNEKKGRHKAFPFSLQHFLNLTEATGRQPWLYPTGCNGSRQSGR
jgi:hypothetical protein